jgi:FtsZ-interacting cell division protein YlmF
MAIRDTWRRSLEYFGLVEGDYIEEGEYVEGDTGQEMALDETAVAPRSFNDAQQVADEFKRSKPVIINLQSTDRELSKRLIDFSSGMTYALGGGMQRISQGIFLLTPQNVEVSAEEKARLLEGGFFNQS